MFRQLALTSPPIQVLDTLFLAPLDVVLSSYDVVEPDLC